MAGSGRAMKRLLLCGWLAFAAPGLAAQDGAKEKVKEAARAVGEAAVEVGHTVRKGAEEVKEGAKKAGKAVGEAGRKVGHAVKEGAVATKEGVKKGAHKVGQAVSKKGDAPAKAE